MDIAEETDRGMSICKTYRAEISIKTTLSHLLKNSAKQKTRYFCQNLSDIQKRTNCISSSSDSTLLIVALVKNKDEFASKKVMSNSLSYCMKWKNMTKTIKNVKLEFYICEIGKTLLLFVCLFKTLKKFSNTDGLDYSKLELMVLEPPVWKSIISETISEILASPETDESFRMFSHPCFKLRLNRLDISMSPDASLKKLQMKGSSPKENETRRSSDSTDLIFVVLGWSGNNPTETIEVFDVATQKWSFFQRETRFMRAYHGVAIFGCKLYIIGGYNGFTCLHTTLCLNMKSRRWSRKSPMSISRCYVSTITHKGYIYVFGGHNGANRLKSCERYDPRRNKWVRISDMMYRRSDASGAELNGRIFISGGFDGFQFHHTTEMYDPENDEWMLVGNLINPRSGHGMISFDGQLFVLGGFNGTLRLRNVEKYNEETDEWEEYIPMLYGRSNFCCVVFKQEIYVIGGYNGITTIDSVEVFNKTLMDWQQAPSLNIDRSAAGACVMNNSENITTCALNEFLPVISHDIEEQSP